MPALWRYVCVHGLGSPQAPRVLKKTPERDWSAGRWSLDPLEEPKHGRDSLCKRFASHPRPALGLVLERSPTDTKGWWHDGFSGCRLVATPANRKIALEP